VAGTTPARSSARFQTINAALREVFRRNDVAGLSAVGRHAEGMRLRGRLRQCERATGAGDDLDSRVRAGRSITRSPHRDGMHGS